MSQPAANCPNCGALVQFRWSGAVQTTCEYCRSILVRRDLNLEKVGEVGDLPREVSPIQIGTEGTFHNKAFQVVGRILYEFENGGWNEWHIVFNDGVSGWLSDAQLEYTVSSLTTPPEVLLSADQIARARLFFWGGVRYEVTSVTRAHYRGVAGELPFEYWDKKDVVFADLRTADARFGTIDYSEATPLLFLGEALEFDDLRLKNLREFDGAVLIRAFERDERRLFLTERIVDQRDPERRHVLLPGARFELLQDSPCVARPARHRVRVSQIRLEPQIPLRHFEGGLELAGRFIQTAHEQERHAELEVCTRTPGNDLERAAEFRDRAIEIIAGRPRAH